MRCAVILCGLLSAGRTYADSIASGSLQVRGNSLTIYSDGTVNDAVQTINVGERARVRTCFGAVGASCGTVSAGDPRIAGLVVRGELRGPELPQALTLEALPGGSFVLPGFEQEGEYRLENVRLVDRATGDVLGAASPAVALVHVRQILLTSASVRTLSLAELAARGISLGAGNFQAFDFAVGFAFGSEIVEIRLPIAYDGHGTVQPLEAQPTVQLDGLPSEIRGVVERWQPPRIVPFRLDLMPVPGVEPQQENDEELSLPLFGAIVLPGTVSYLNQFFAARLVVANGAPPGSAVRLEEITGNLRLPVDHSLRVAATDPAVAVGQPLPVRTASGAGGLEPGEQGTAEWTIEGLIAGSQAVQIDVEASLARPGREPLPLLSRLQAAIEVVDARFNLTFSHPDVVREGEAYSLYVTLSNLSRVAQNLITVDLDEAHFTGAHRADPADDLRRTVDTLAPGQAETFEYRLVADVTGQVIASTFQATSTAGQGTIRFRTGVGELGIPLSPATLVLPRFSERLRPPYVASDDFFRAANRFLGLAYSLAVAPSSAVPPGLPRVIRTDIETRAIDLGQAGMRTFVGEPLLESLEVLALDQLGNRDARAEIDELRRQTEKGQAIGRELAALVSGEQQQRGLGAVALFDHFVATTTYTAPYLAALLVPAGDPAGLELEVRGAAGPLRGMAGAAGSVRELPFGEVLGVRRDAAGSAVVPLALVGHLALDQELDVVIHNPGAVLVHGHLSVVMPSADGLEDRRLEVSDLTVPPGGEVRLRVGAAVTSPALVDATGHPLPTSVASALVSRPPFRLIGIAQDFRLNESHSPKGALFRPNRYGEGVVLLFNRPPTRESVDRAASYRIQSRFAGLDTGGAPASMETTKTADATFWQADRRVVALRLSTPLSALVDPATGLALLDHEADFDRGGIVDDWGESLGGDLPAPQIEASPLHVGGLLTGRVLRGDGSPVAGAEVRLIRRRLIPSPEDLLQVHDEDFDVAGVLTTGADGRFSFDFVETPHWDELVFPQFILRAVVPKGADPQLEPAVEQEVSSTIRLQNRLARVNIALLGRGTIRGTVLDATSGLPVPHGKVWATSTLFNEAKRVDVGIDGTFVLAGVPVGPVTLTARDDDFGVVYATVGVSQPGAVVEVTLRLQRVQTGRVVGRVVDAVSGEPIPRVDVGVYARGATIDRALTDLLGRFAFERVPAGQVTLQAARWKVSRQPVLTDLNLAPGETQDVTLRLPVGGSRVVEGSVLFHDPVTNRDVPVQGAVAFISGPGVYAYTDATGRYRIEGVPVQGAEDPYQVTAIDFTRQLQGAVVLPPVLDVSPDVIQAQAIVLESMEGGVDGVVLDPLGRPLGEAIVEIPPYVGTTSRSDGSFGLDEVELGTHTVVVHLGDGLEPGRIGYFCEAQVTIAYGGHRPFVTLRMVGGGGARVTTKTATATGVLTPIYYKPTYYSASEHRVRKKGTYTETSTDPNGLLELALPVGGYEIVAYNPFHGVHTINGQIDYSGQIVHHDIVFGDAASVAGLVVGTDGRTPVPFADVVLEAGGLAPQHQRAGADGRFRYELVPKGRVTVSASGIAGTVERVGRVLGYVGTAGQTLDVVIQMKQQGTVSGTVQQSLNGSVTPLAHAQYYLQEGSYPYRRLPADGEWSFTDAQGRFTVPHVYAGGVTVVARDSGQVSRTALVRGTVGGDWQQLALPPIVMTTNFGTLQVTVRNPMTGGPVADAQVRLPQVNDATVTGPDGVAVFDALALGTYEVNVFYAPTGQASRITGVALSAPGQHVARTTFLDQRGEVRGTLWDDAAHTAAVPGGTIRLTGETAGGRVIALTTTSSEAATQGRFELLGIPEGSYLLEAGVTSSARRAATTATLTATSPVVDLNLVLEPAEDRYVRLFENRRSGLTPVPLGAGVFSVRLSQSGYDFTQIAPATADLFRFPTVLLNREGWLSAQELNAERRRGSAYFSRFTGSQPAGPCGGAPAGTDVEPYCLLLGAKGAVRVWVKDAEGAVVPGASVTLNADGVVFPSVTGADGAVSFAAVPAGGLRATARLSSNGTSGQTSGTLTYDDDVVELSIALEPAVSLRGVVYQPTPNDLPPTDLSTLVAAPGIIVTLLADRGQGQQVVMSDAQGAYAFAGLKPGPYRIGARSNNGDQLGGTSGALVGPNGNENTAAPIVLDAGPPRLLSVSPPPGAEGVSRTAMVELLFSEPLAAPPVNAANTPYGAFRLQGPSGVADGLWTSTLDAAGHQLVRFVPTAPYANQTIYALRILSNVKDRAGRDLSTNGDIGSTFRTADTIGPAVIGTVPDLGRPVPPLGAVRIDFSEAVRATDAQLDGDLAGDAIELYGQSSDGGSPAWHRLPVTSFLTRSNYSLSFAPVDGFTLAGDTLARKVVLVGLRDVYDNVMPSYERVYQLYDAHPPTIDTVPFPANAATGELLQGDTYTVLPVISGLDGSDAGHPSGDLDRVDYYAEDPTQPNHPVAPVYSARGGAAGFSYTFVAAYVGDGSSPRPFPLWLRAVDTSTNASNLGQVTLAVLPNATPTIERVELVATAPVAGTAYPGSTLVATASGFADADGSQLTLVAELWAEGGTAPLAQSPTRPLPRPTGGWTAAEAQSFELTLPIDTAPNLTVVARVRAIDGDGASGVTESPAITVTADTMPPRIDDFSLRLAGDAVAAAFIGEEVYFEVRASDVETGVQQLSLELDRQDLFPGPLAATLVAGTSDLYRSGVVGVPEDLASSATVTAHLLVTDRSANEAVQNLTFTVGPERDAAAPQARWRVPWQGALWPADYTSTVSPDGTTLLLRLYGRDVNLDQDGNLIPGRLVSVEVRGPVRDAGTNALQLASEWQPAERVAGTEDGVGAYYQAAWQIPNNVPAGTELRFETRLLDAAHTEVIVPVTMTAVLPRRVYEAVLTSVAAEDPMLAPDGTEDGPVFLLGGSTLSVVPQPDHAPRQLPALLLYPGAETAVGTLTPLPTVLTAPEVTSYDSAILYHPLELDIEHELAIAAETRIDLSGRGLLGSTSTREMLLPGMVGPSGAAGGSHGGRGWFGPTDRFEDPFLYPAGETYDSVREPGLPGGGGGGSGPAGAGGGVVRIAATAARVRIDGAIVADGATGPYGGGAGGAVRLAVGRLEGVGAIQARGGQAGGGGGRVAVTYRELASHYDPSAQVSVVGGAARSGYLELDRRAGAGTVYLEQVDPEGGASDGGALLIRNPVVPNAGSALTPLPTLAAGTVESVDVVTGWLGVTTSFARGSVVGETLVLSAGADVLGEVVVAAQSVSTPGPQPGTLRLDLRTSATAGQLAAISEAIQAGAVGFAIASSFETVLADGTVRLLADHDLRLGPDHAVNARSQILLRRGARVMLAGEGPSVRYVATPAIGSGAARGSWVVANWTVSDPLGIRDTEVSTSESATATARAYPLTPTSAGGEVPAAIAIPLLTPPASVAVRLVVRDIAGRELVSEPTWPVLPDAPPTGSLSLATTGATPVRGGYPFQVRVHAADREALSRVRLDIEGPAAAAGPLEADVQGNDAWADFYVRPDALLDGSLPIRLTATIEDVAGGSATTPTLEVPTAANDVPRAVLSLSADSGWVIAHVTADDADGLDHVVVHWQGPVAESEQDGAFQYPYPRHSVTEYWNQLLTPADGPITAWLELFDRTGVAGQTAPVTFEIEAPPPTDPRTVVLTMEPDVWSFYPGDAAQLVASIVDPDPQPGLGDYRIELEVDGAVYTATNGSVTAPWTAPAVGDSTEITFFARLFNEHGLLHETARTVFVNPAPRISVEPSCPRTGAVLPANDVVALSFTTSAEVGSTARFFVGESTVPFAETTTEDPYYGTASATFDLSTLEAPEVTFRVELTDVHGAFGEGSVTIQRVATVDLAADGGNDWLALQTQVGVLRDGTLSLDQPRALGGLIVLGGARVTQPPLAVGQPYRGLSVTASGPVYVACGGAIDVSGKGYGPGQTYPGIAEASVAGHFGLPASAPPGLRPVYGNVYGPVEAGAGGLGRGGGAVRLIGGHVQIDGEVRADGESDGAGAGAGGSVWITAASYAATGRVSATGGSWEDQSPGGGGGAITIEAGELPADLTQGDVSGGIDAGAGAVLTKGPNATFGDLSLGYGSSALPALGAGVAQPGSAGTRLVVDRPAVPGSFVGHWIEVCGATSGVLKGTWRIASIDATGRALTLAGAGGEAISVAQGDRWQGVYRFDNVGLSGTVLDGGDPMRVNGELGASDTSAERLEADRVVIYGGVTPRPGQPLTIQGREVHIQGTVDATGAGYPPGETFPGHVPPGSDEGAAHLGRGGALNGTPLAEAYGSLYRPQELGGGGAVDEPGGGVLRIEADSLTVDGEVRANGVNGGAGGSVWISTRSLAGSGLIQAAGGDARDVASGGGGAIAIEYEELDPDSTVLGSLATRPEANQEGHHQVAPGEGGTIVLRGPGQTNGTLIVESEAPMPSLGSGFAGDGSAGPVLHTDRLRPIPSYFVGHWVEVSDGSSGAVKGAWRIGAIAGDRTTVTLERGNGAPPSVAEGDRWQGFYAFDRLELRTGLTSADPVRVAGETVVTGEIRADRIQGTSLHLSEGAILRGKTAGRLLEIDVDDFSLAPGATVDVSGLGYDPGASYYPLGLPAESANASHLGEGARTFSFEDFPSQRTYGSVTRPQEPGGGTWSPGGGAVRIRAQHARIDGSVLADGGAGGSVWIVASALEGTGHVSASGGFAAGGGAVSLQYQSLAPGAEIVRHLYAGGDGSGTVLVSGSDSTFGDLELTGASIWGHHPFGTVHLVETPRTVLPALGSGLAAVGSGGSVLVTDREEPIPTFFVGHWVELRSASTGALRGTYQVSEVGADGRTLVLVATSGPPPTVSAGDQWQGVYRFDRVASPGSAELVSDDPIRIGSQVDVSGLLAIAQVEAPRVVVRHGGTLSAPSWRNGAPQPLNVLADEIEVEAGGRIDATGLGLGAGPETPTSSSHLGVGSAPLGIDRSTFGSVERPQEPGGGGSTLESGLGRQTWGGGSIHLVSASLLVDGAVAADGLWGGAGGSVWIEAGQLSGLGQLSARNAAADGYSSGGGGAVAVRYDELAASSSLLEHVDLRGAGAGTLFVHPSSQAFGDLIVDTTASPYGQTVLPALGAGVAGPGSGGDRLVTGRAEAIPAYFVGHWVEIHDGITGALEGTWRVGSIEEDGRTVRIEGIVAAGSEVEPGDRWQGVYRFNSMPRIGAGEVRSDDPIQLEAPEQVIEGTVEAGEIHADHLTIRSGASLRPRLDGATPGHLDIEAREVTIESGGAIDASGHGYGAVSFPGAGAGSKGSHLGEGASSGFWPPPETYGSVAEPREHGTAALNGAGAAGGGSVHVRTDLLRVDGAILANGSGDYASGGSVWLETDALSGEGQVQARGTLGAGGGAVSIAYATLDPASSVLDQTDALGGIGASPGGAGTVHVRGPGATLGTLVVDNGTSVGGGRTVLPALGRGRVMPGSHDGWVVTDRATEVPAYFAGHWVEVEGPDRIVKGVWQIGSVDGTNFGLVPNGEQPVTAAPGDRWRGVYRFAEVRVAEGAVLATTEKLVQYVPPLPDLAELDAAPSRSATALSAAAASGSFESLYGNDEAPLWNKAAVSVAVGSFPGSYRIAVAANALSDPDGVREVHLTGGGVDVAQAWSASGTTFYWTGTAGQRLSLVATDGHRRFQRSAWLELPPLPAAGQGSAVSLATGVTPLAVAGGEAWTAVADDGVWVTGATPAESWSVPPRANDQQVSRLAADGPWLAFLAGQRVDVVDRPARTLFESSLPSMPVDLVAGADRLSVLAASSDPQVAGFELAEWSLGGSAPQPVAEATPHLPQLVSPRVLRTGDALHVFGSEPDGTPVAYTWSVARGDAPLADAAERWPATAAWTAVGAWDRGALLIEATSVRLAVWDAGWREAARVDVGAPVLSAAASGDWLVVLVAGEVLTYDVSDPAAPLLAARHPGSSYRAVEPLGGGELLLWAPRSATPPLRFVPATAVPGAGFTTVIEGLP